MPAAKPHRHALQIWLFAGIAVLLVSFALSVSFRVLEIEVAAILLAGLLLLLLCGLLYSPRRREWMIGLGMTAFVVVATLGLGEVAARWNTADITTSDDSAPFFYQRWLATENVTLNRFGFRERDFADVAAPGVRRIAVIGDSLTYGQGIPTAARLTERLAARLNEGDRRYEVLNFGKSGAETVDELATLRNIVLPLKPDVVLLQWFPNDIEGRDRANRPRPSNLIPIKRFHIWFARHSALYSLANMGFRNALVSLGIDADYVGALVRRFADPAGANWQGFEGDFRDFIELAQSRDLPLAIYLNPLFMPQLTEGDYPLAFAHERVMAICAEYGVPCLDLRDAYAATGDIERLKVNRYERHPGAYANEVMTDAVYDAFYSTLTGSD